MREKMLWFIVTGIIVVVVFLLLVAFAPRLIDSLSRSFASVWSWMEGLI